jgi:hypothetical protein
MKVGQHGDTMKKLTGCLERLRHEYEEFHPRIADCLFYIAEGNLKVGNIASAREAAEECLTIREKLFREDDPAIKKTRDFLAALCPVA